MNPKQKMSDMDSEPPNKRFRAAETAIVHNVESKFRNGREMSLELRHDPATTNKGNLPMKITFDGKTKTMRFLIFGPALRVADSRVIFFRLSLLDNNERAYERFANVKTHPDTNSISCAVSDRELHFDVDGGWTQVQRITLERIPEFASVK